MLQKEEVVSYGCKKDNIHPRYILHSSTIKGRPSDLKCTQPWNLHAETSWICTTGQWIISLNPSICIVFWWSFIINRNEQWMSITIPTMLRYYFPSTFRSTWSLLLSILHSWQDREKVSPPPSSFISKRNVETLWHCSLVYHSIKYTLKLRLVPRFVKLVHKNFF